MTGRDKHKIPITILICDDDEDDRLTIRQTLESARIANELRFVDRGVALLDYLYQRGPFAGETGAAPRPGLILLNVDGDAGDNRDALRHIRDTPAFLNIPVFALTTAPLDGDAARRATLGVHSFVAKPLTFSGFVDAMNTLGRYWWQIVESLPTPA